MIGHYLEFVLLKIWLIKATASCLSEDIFITTSSLAKITLSNLSTILLQTFKKLSVNSESCEAEKNTNVEFGSAL